jgi:phosphocarrier protein HPr
MSERTVVIGSSVGLHARPAALFTQKVAAQPIAVNVGRPGEEPVDAGSILMVLALGVSHGESVVISADGEGSEPLLDELAELLARDLDAE